MDEIIANEQYVISSSKKLRCGYTTGSCAAMAAKACIIYCLTGKKIDSVKIVTPKGWIAQACVIWKENRCGVKKDAGDDSDVTNGIEIYASAKFFHDENCEGVIVEIDGGEGVGRITKSGLDQKVGNAAINSVPRKMIEKEVMAVCEKNGFRGRVKIVIDVPQGKEIAKKTFNPVLGIEGGISILGTTGVVQPMSVQALLEALEVEMNVAFESVKNDDFRPLIITPGEYGTAFLSQYDFKVPVIKCSNYIGDVIDMAKVFGFTDVFMAGHAGKMVKLAGGIFNTHSHVADCRVEIFASHAALCGADRNTVSLLMDCATVDACIDVLDSAEKVVRDDVIKSIMKNIEKNLKRRIGDSFCWSFLMFTNQHGILAKTSNAEQMMNSFC